MDIDFLRAVKIFNAVADTGSMTAAARSLRITQSAISQHIKLLERDLKVSLIDRDNRPLRLTQAGTALRHHAGRLLQLADTTRAEVRKVAAGPLPHLRVAIFGTLARALSPAIVAAVADRRLAVEHVSIMRGLSANHVTELLNRDVDVVITSNALEDVEGLERHDLIHEQFIVVLPRNAAPRQASLQDIAARLPLIRYTARTSLGVMVERHLRRLRLEIPQTYACDNPEDLLDMVSNGHGWAITAPSHVLHVLKPPLPIEARALPPPALGRRITLVARTGEIGDMPEKLAALCREVLGRDYVQRMTAMLPALVGDFRIL
jgi:DNA-binding transcriptional LysR family regulator